MTRAGTTATRTTATRTVTTRTVTPVLLAEARLDDDASLAVFRAVLAATSRPGRVTPAPQGINGSIPPVLLPALALADLEIALSVLTADAVDGADDAVDWADVVVRATGARRATGPADADLVVALRPPTPAEIATLRTGDAHAPERGARLIVSCTGFDGHGPDGHGDGGVTLRITGPGTGGGRTVAVGGIVPELVTALMAANDRFPAGIDTWFVAPDGAMVGLPRSASAAPGDGPRGEPRRDGAETRST